MARVEGQTPTGLWTLSVVTLLVILGIFVALEYYRIINVFNLF